MPPPLAPLLETPRLLLRTFESSDTKALFEIVGDPKVMEFWAQGPARTLSQTAIFLQKAIQHWKQHGCGDWALIEKKRKHSYRLLQLRIYAALERGNNWLCD